MYSIHIHRVINIYEDATHKVRKSNFSCHTGCTGFQQVFVIEVNSHRDQIMELDKTGTHLKYFSQKQDVVLIKNLLLSVQSRWEKVVQRSVERGRLLDDAKKRAKQVTKVPFDYTTYSFNQKIKIINIKTYLFLKKIAGAGFWK